MLMSCQQNLGKLTFVMKKMNMLSITFDRIIISLWLPSLYHTECMTWLHNNSFWRMGHARLVRTLAATVGGEGRLWDPGIPDSLLVSTSWSNSLIIGIYPESNDRSHAIMSPLYKIMVSLLGYLTRVNIVILHHHSAILPHYSIISDTASGGELYSSLVHNCL